MTELTLTVNGQKRRLPAPATVADLLDHLGLDPRGVVVELNEDIVRRPRVPHTPLGDGDRIELVHFVGGG